VRPQISRPAAPVVGAVHPLEQQVGQRRRGQPDQDAAADQPGVDRHRRVRTRAIRHAERADHDRQQHRQAERAPAGDRRHDLRPRRCHTWRSSLSG
jgi:hypothetical protein